MDNKPQHLEASFKGVAYQNLDYSEKQGEVFPNGVSFSESWEVLMSDTSKGIVVDIPEFQEREELDLPHRILLPDHSIWYRKQLSLKKGVLIVNADDGAQIFVDGKQIPRIDGPVFPVDEDLDSVTLVVRVINNAMKGGLRAVSNVEANTWQEFVLDQMDEDSVWLQNRKQMLDNNDTNGPILLTDPVLQKSGDGQFFLRWVSEKPGEAKLHWSLGNGELDQSLLAKSTDGVFLVSIPAIEGDINFRIEQEGIYSKVYSKKMIPNGDKISFGVWGDSQSGWHIFNQVMTAMDTNKVSFTVGCGDLVGRGYREYEYLHLLQALSKTSTTHYPIAGNHDYDGFYDDLKPEYYEKYVKLPGQSQYFSWKEGNCAFIALDPHVNFPVGIEEGSDQYNWFLKQLESEFWTSAKWRFVALHHPPISQGWPGYHGEQSVLKLLEPHFESADIDFVLAGHTHDYEHLQKYYGDQEVNFLIVGGAGGHVEPDGLSEWPVMDKVVKEHHYGIFDVDDLKISFKAYNLNGMVIDSLSVSKEIEKTLAQN